MIYFDQSATTAPNESVLNTYVTVSQRFFGNPSSLHTLGQQAEALLRKSTRQVAQLLQIQPKEIVFTSGATESNNMAIKGVAYQYQNRGNHIITTCTEHSSVLQVCKQLETQGFHITYLPVDHQGRICLDDLKAALTDQTILVSIQHVNNEVGTIQPIHEIGAFLQAYPTVIFHVDGVQGIGKVPLNLHDCGIDLYALSGHKFHCVKGVGLLYVRNGIRLSPLIIGGGQQMRLRAGTENLPGIAAFAKALRLALEDVENKRVQIKGIQDYLRKEMLQIKDVTIHTPLQYAAPHILNLSISDIKPEVLIQELSKHEIYISSRSACSTKENHASHVLLAMGRSENEARTSLRFSFSSENTEVQAQQVMQVFPNIVQQIQDMMR